VLVLGEIVRVAVQRQHVLFDEGADADAKGFDFGGEGEVHDRSFFRRRQTSTSIGTPSTRAISFSTAVVPFLRPFSRSEIYPWPMFVLYDKYNWVMSFHSRMTRIAFSPLAMRSATSIGKSGAPAAISSRARATSRAVPASSSASLALATSASYSLRGRMATSPLSVFLKRTVIIMRPFNRRFPCDGRL